MRFCVIIAAFVLVTATSSFCADSGEFEQRPDPNRTALSASVNLWSPAVDWETEATARANTTHFVGDNAVSDDDSWRPGFGLGLLRTWSNGYRLRLGYQYTSKSEWQGPVHWSEGSVLVYSNDTRDAMEYSLHSLSVTFSRSMGVLFEGADWYLGAGAAGFVLRFPNASYLRPPYSGSIDAEDLSTVTWANATNVGFAVFPLVGCEIELEHGFGLFAEASFQIGRTLNDTDNESHDIDGGVAVEERSGHFELMGPSLAIGLNLYF